MGFVVPKLKGVRAWGLSFEVKALRCGSFLFILTMGPGSASLTSEA